MPTKVRDKLQETNAGKRRFNWDGAVQSVTKQRKQEESVGARTHTHSKSFLFTLILTAMNGLR